MRASAILTLCLGVVCMMRAASSKSEGRVSNDCELRLWIEAFVDSKTDQWMARLTCGLSPFSDRPSMDVTWNTPDDKGRLSNDHSEGLFYLYLTPPVLSGKYTCRLTTKSSAEPCIPASGGSKVLEAHIALDEYLPEIVILEARFAKLEAENDELKANQAGLNKQLYKLDQKKTRVREKMRKQEGEVERMRGEIASAVEKLDDWQGKWTKMLEQKKNIDKNLGGNYALMLRRRQEGFLGQDEGVRMDDVLLNVGDVYIHNGWFFPREAGTYVFFVKAVSAWNNGFTLRLMCTDNDRELNSILNLASYDDQFETVSGTVVTHLEYAQHVLLQTGDTHENFVSKHLTWGGFLLRPDFQEF